LTEPAREPGHLNFKNLSITDPYTAGWQVQPDTDGSAYTVRSAGNVGIGTSTSFSAADIT